MYYNILALYNTVLVRVVLYFSFVYTPSMFKIESGCKLNR